MKTSARRRQIYLQLVVVLQGRGPKSRKEEGSHRLSTQMQSSCHGVKASRLPRRRETPREMELGLKSSGSPLGRLGER